jgi:hypothetical protein
MGLIIGLLGKFVAPGDRDNIPHWLTVLCGIAGVLIGYYVAAAPAIEATQSPRLDSVDHQHHRRGDPGRDRRDGYPVAAAG